jgi:hypothetical protein
MWRSQPGYVVKSVVDFHRWKNLTHARVCRTGMGWYHAVQMLRGDVPSCALAYIVEPWFLSAAGSAGPGGAEFMAWKAQVEEQNGIQFLTKVEDLPSTDRPRLALISGRTADNPRLLSECIKVRECLIYV